MVPSLVLAVALTVNARHAVTSPSVKPFALGAMSSSPTVSAAEASLPEGTVQMVPPWAQPTAGHHPHYEP
jgi:hypothetical protein